MTTSDFRLWTLVRSSGRMKKKKKKKKKKSGSHVDSISYLLFFKVQDEQKWKIIFYSKSFDPN